MVDRDRLYSDLNEGILAERRAAFERNLRNNLPLIRSHGGLQRIIAGPEGQDGRCHRRRPVARRKSRRAQTVPAAARTGLHRRGHGPPAPGVAWGSGRASSFPAKPAPLTFSATSIPTGMHLVAFSCMSRVNLRRWRGDMSFYNWMIHRPEYAALWDTAGRDLGFVGTGQPGHHPGGGLRARVRRQGARAGRQRSRIRRPVLRPGHGGAPEHARSCLHGSPPVKRAEMRRSRRAMEYRIQRGARVSFTRPGSSLRANCGSRTFSGRARSRCTTAVIPGVRKNMLQKWN